MQKRSSRKDLNQIAAEMVRQTAGLDLKGKNPAAVALGRRGGLKGGKARAKALSEERRIEIARTAAHARWKDTHGLED
jgi:hypothetical protein